MLPAHLPLQTLVHAGMPSEPCCLLRSCSIECGGVWNSAAFFVSHMVLAVEEFLATVKTFSNGFVKLNVTNSSTLLQLSLQVLQCFLNL